MFKLPFSLTDNEKIDSLIQAFEEFKTETSSRIETLQNTIERQSRNIRTLERNNDELYFILQNQYCVIDDVKTRLQIQIDDLGKIGQLNRDAVEKNIRDDLQELKQRVEAVSNAEIILSPNEKVFSFAMNSKYIRLCDNHKRVLGHNINNYTDILTKLKYFYQLEELTITGMPQLSECQYYISNTNLKKLIFYTGSCKFNNWDFLQNLPNLEQLIFADIDNSSNICCGNIDVLKNNNPKLKTIIVINSPQLLYPIIQELYTYCRQHDIEVIIQ